MLRYIFVKVCESCIATVKTNPYTLCMYVPTKETFSIWKEYSQTTQMM